jgi:hypothetical protein
MSPCNVDNFVYNPLYLISTIWKKIVGILKVYKDLSKKIKLKVYKEVNIKINY